MWTHIRGSVGGPGLVEGVVQGYVHRTMQGTAGPGAAGAVRVHAFHDREPPGPAVLWVQGICTFGTPGYTVGALPPRAAGHQPPRPAPRPEVTPPDGVVAQVVTTVEVRYEEETDAGFDTVTILPAGTSVPVQTVV